MSLSLKKLTAVFCLLTIPFFAQKNKVPTASQLQIYYKQAISDYLKDCRQNYKLTIDTLYFGKHDQFPNIKLPEKIAETPIKMITPDAGAVLLKKKKNIHYINLISWGTEEAYEFKLIAFSFGAVHVLDWYAVYDFSQHKKAKKISSRFENFRFGKE
jgi:hypothetical protein